MCSSIECTSIFAIIRPTTGQIASKPERGGALGALDRGAAENITVQFKENEFINSTVNDVFKLSKRARAGGG